MNKSYRMLLALILVSLLSQDLFSLTKLPDYEPYKKDEFPSWAQNLRRAESLSFGATALTFPVINLVFGQKRIVSDTFDPVTGEVKDRSTLDFLAKFGVSVGVGVVVAVIDAIIGVVEKKKSKVGEINGVSGGAEIQVSDEATVKAENALAELQNKKITQEAGNSSEL